MRHHLGLHHLARDPRIRRAAANGEVVGGGDDGAATHQRLAEEEGGGGDVREVAIDVILGAARDLADLAEGALVDERREPRAGVHLPAPMLPRNLVRAAHLRGKRFAAAQFFEFPGPGHVSSPGRGGGGAQR